MTAAGLVFSNIHDRSIPEMTAKRTMASVPFGGRYRLIDFTLSNMVNSGIVKVGIITHNNYRSLVDHLGSGKDWDLARRSGGIMVLPPFITAFDNPRANNLYSTKLEALMGVMDFISHCEEELIVLSDSDLVCNIDLTDVLEAHENTASDVTFVSKRIDLAVASKDAKIILADDDGKVSGFVEKTQLMQGEYDISTNIIVFNREFLLQMLHTSISHGFTDFYSQALPFFMYSSKYSIYRYDGFCRVVDSLADYFNANMNVLDAAIRKDLFGRKSRPVYTKVRNSSPTVYGENSSVKNSLIADGCRIEGVVENSVIFRGVHVKKGAVVKNSVILQNTIVSDNAELNCVITDKNVVVLDGRRLSGHETMPFYISKGKTV